MRRWAGSSTSTARRRSTTKRLFSHVRSYICRSGRRDRRRGGDRRGQHRRRRSGHVPRGTARQCREGERTAHPGGVRELGRADVGQEGGREPRSGRPAQGGVGFRPADRRGNPRGDGPHRRRGGRRDDVRRRTVARRLAQTRAGRASRCGPGAFGGAAAGGAAGGKRGGGRGCRRHRGDRRHDLAPGRRIPERRGGDCACRAGRRRTVRRGGDALCGGFRRRAGPDACETRAGDRGGGRAQRHHGRCAGFGQDDARTASADDPAAAFARRGARNDQDTLRGGQGGHDGRADDPAAVSRSASYGFAGRRDRRRAVAPAGRGVAGPQRRAVPR